MNTNSCQPGWASDEIFICNTNYDNGKPPCQTPIAAYATLMGVLILLRIWILIRQFQVWRAREALRPKHQVPVAGTQTTVRKKRYPLVAINGFLTVIILTLFTVLTCLNIVTCRNGSSGPLLYIFFAPLTLTALTYGERIMRLGRTLIPLSKTQLEISQTQEKKIMEPDFILAILNFLTKVAWIIQPIALLIVAPIYPGNFLPLAVGIGLYSVIDWFATSAWSWQLWRLVIVASGAQNRDKDGGKINGVITQLKVNAFSLLSGGILFGSLWMLLAIQVLQFAWYFVVFFMSNEAFTSFIFVLRFRKSASGTNSGSNTTSSNTKKPENQGQSIEAFSGGGGGGGKQDITVTAEGGSMVE